MTSIVNDIAYAALAYPAAIGAAVSYSIYGSSRWTPLIVGAALGYPAYAAVQYGAVMLPVPVEVTIAAPEMLAGGVIAYNLYGGSLPAVAVGVAAGAAVKYVVGLSAASAAVDALGGHSPRLRL
jgi:hypothetical protein